MPDVCCSICRSQFGVCLTGYRCEHHVTARIEEDANDRARKLYANPTQDQAIANVMRARNPKRRAKYKED